MATINSKVAFEPIELKVGQGWCVRVMLPQRKQPQLGNFRTEVEAQEWIKRRSLAWLRKYERCSKSNRPMSPTAKPRRRRTLSRRQMPLTSRSLSARIAAAACAASGASPYRQPAPFAATHHDDKPRPDLDRFRLPTPPSHCAAGAEDRRLARAASPRFGLDSVIVVTDRGARTPAIKRSNRSTIASCRLRSAQPGVQIETAAALSP